MTFTKLIAIFAITAMAANATAASDGTLRRNTEVAQTDQPTTAFTTSQQPVTVVEASPVVESKAEALRKARQDAEVQTEQKIVEKLEDSRLREERERADRLFGNKLDPAPAPVPAVVAAPVAAPAPTPAPVAVAPVEAPEKKDQQTNVTIEKIEIIQPQTPVQEDASAPVPAPAVAEETSKTQAPVVEEQPEAKSRYYVSGLAGNLSYNANNVKSNYGLGVAVGTIIQERWAIELSYFFSNHNVYDFWQQALYKNMDQNDIAAAGKYYILSGKLKPYVGASVTYITRNYSDRSTYGTYYYANQYKTSDSTQAVDMGLLGGVDFAINDQFMIGAGIDYNFNVMNTNPINYNTYGLPADTKDLEKIDYFAIKINAKFLF